MFETMLVIGSALVTAGVIRGVSQTLFHRYKPKAKGNAGEGKTDRKLRRFARKEKDGVTLRDLLLPARTGTSQIDNILVNRYGIFVIEVKNYAGRVYGGIKDRLWYHESAGKTKQMHSFLNPTIQNNGHVAALRALLKNHPNLRYYPIVAFSNNCELVGVTPNVVNFRDLIIAIKMRCQGEPLLSEEEVRQIAAELKELNIPGRQARKEHALRASLSASAAKKGDNSGLESLYAQARNAPTLFMDEHPEPTQSVPKERAMLTDAGAMVRIKGKTDSIEHFFERSKRDGQGLPVPEKAAFTHFICPYTGKTFPVSEARPFYRGLWATYLKQNPELVSYLERLGPDRIRCASQRTETLLRAYVQDSAAFQAEIRQSRWYQNMVQYQKGRKGPTQRQALDKIMTEHPPQMKSIQERKPSLDNQINKADKSKQASQNHKDHTHDTLTH